MPDYKGKLTGQQIDNLPAEIEQCKAATAGAENLNVTMSGTTITITSRDGSKKTVNIKGERGSVEYVANVAPTPISSEGVDAQIYNYNLNTTGLGNPTTADFILFGTKKYSIVMVQPVRDGSIYILKLVSDSQGDVYTKSETNTKISDSIKPVSDKVTTIETELQGLADILDRI